MVLRIARGYPPVTLTEKKMAALVAAGSKHLFT